MSLSKQSFIGNAPGQMRHQAIVVDSVENQVKSKSQWYPAVIYSCARITA